MKNIRLKTFIPLAFILLIIILGKTKEIESNYHLYQKKEWINNLRSEPQFRFNEVSKQLNITHKHELYSPSPSRVGYSKLLPYNASVGVGDINNDGFMDLFFNTAREGQRNFLYLNNSGKDFTDISIEWGLGDEINDPASTMGGYFFDYDNDGRTDLFLAKAGCHSLYKNMGTHFVDVSDATGVSNVCTYASGVSFLDFDKDGFLDVYISNSLNAGSEKMISGKDLEILEPQRNEYGLVIYRQDVLLKNQNGKNFTDVTKQAGIDNNHLNWVTGVTDYNNDGYPDLFLANDFSTNRLLKNNGDGSFSDRSQEALGSQFFSGNMSATIGDYDNDGFQDIFVSNLTRSTWYIRMMNWLYKSNGDGTFSSQSRQKKLDRCSWAWGSNFADIDRDGWLDLFVTTGLFNDGEKSFQYKMETYHVVPILLFTDSRNFPKTSGHQLAGRDRSCFFWQQDGEFYDVAEKVGLDEPFVGRGSAIVDIDNNGTLDIIVAAHNDHPRVYLNEVGNSYNWVGLKLVGSKSNRDALGAKVVAHFKDGIQSRELYPTNGYSSQSDPRVYFGLGERDLLYLEVNWPSGRKNIVKAIELNKYTEIREAN